MNKSTQPTQKPNKRPTPFKDPAIRAKATENSKGKPRPNRKSKKEVIHEAKVKIVSEELIKSGYLELVQKSMPSVIKAHIKVASNPRASATQERKLLFQGVGIIGKEQKEAAQTIADVLADLFANPSEEEDTQP